MFSRDLTICIPTHKRETLGHHLYDRLPKELLPQVVLFTNSGREPIMRAAKPYANIIDLGEVRGIGDVRHKVVLRCPTKYCFMIDDMVRFNDKVNRCVLESFDDWIRIIDMAMAMVKVYKVAGFIAGEVLPSDYGESVSTNVRLNSNFVIDKDFYRVCGARFDELLNIDDNLLLEEDICFLLRLLYNQHDYAVCRCINQVHTHGKPGGNSIIRTNEIDMKCYEKLSELFPGVINYFLTDSDLSWSVDGKRVKTRIYWKKCKELGAKAYKKKQ